MKKEEQKKSLRGCRTDAMLCAIVFLGCRREATPRTLREISRETGVNQGDIRVAYKALLKIMPAPAQVISAATAPRELIARICEKVEIPFQVTAKAQGATDLVAPFVEGRQPGTVAAAVVSIVCKHFGGARLFERSDQAIADAANISPSTLKKFAHSSTHSRTIITSSHNHTRVQCCE
jgi:transcription initiation factor TFIIIB Brf1 subunit/transcription initiation factor TFIIB